MLSGAAVFLWPLSAITHVLSRSKRILLLTNPTVSLYLSPLLTLNFVAICLTNTSMAFFDVRVLHPSAKSNAKHKTTAKMYGHHERSKERKYGDRCTQIEKGTLNGLVFSTTGGMGPQPTMFLKRVATLLAAKTGQDKSLVMANLSLVMSCSKPYYTSCCERTSRTLLSESDSC